MLSGWLFADLLLAVSIIFLSTARGAAPDSQLVASASATTVPTATATPTPTSTPLPTATVQACRPVPSKQKVELERVGSGRGQDPTDDELREAFARFQNERAFIVMAFPHVPRGQDEAGREKGRKISDRLRVLMPSVFTDVTASDAGRYEDGTPDGQGKVDFWVWFREDNCA